MKIYRQGLYPALLAIAASVAMPSCVDNDYDLAKDIDLTVNVGGDLTLPSSSTERYTLAQIMDLDASSSIQPNGEEYGLDKGDYVLSQTADPTDTIVSIKPQVLHDINCAPSVTQLSFVSLGVGQPVNTELKGFANAIKIADADIDKAVKTLTYVECVIPLNFAINVTSTGAIGSIALQPGFAIQFPASWVVSLANNSLDQYAAFQGNKLVFKKAYNLTAGTPFVLPLMIKGINLKNLPAGQGLYEPGKFKIDERIETSGPISYSPASTPAGQNITVTFEIAPSIPSATINSLTGTVNPDFDVRAISFDINDIPDFLKENDSHLDIYNPQIRLSILNESPVKLSLNCRIEALGQDGKVREVWIGEEYGTDPVLVNNSGPSEICVSRLGIGAPAGGENVEVPHLSDILESIPSRIVIDHISGKVPGDDEITIRLGEDYQVKIDYRAVVPLAFGKDLRFTYTTDEKGWDEDLHKYSFKQAVASMTVENSAPLELTPEVVALDRNGNEITDIKATVEGSVAAGSIAQPSTAILKVTLTSDAANIGNLDGVRFTFSATCPVGFAGTPLNEGQSVRFTDIKLKLVGGVGVDLN